MSVGASLANSGYFSVAAAIISTMNGRCIASQKSACRQLQIKPPASFLMVAIDFGVTNSEAILPVKPYLNLFLDS